MSVSESDYCSLHDNQLKNQLKKKKQQQQKQVVVITSKFAKFLLKKFALFYSFL